MVPDKRKRLRRISTIPIMLTIFAVLFFLTIFNPSNEEFNQLKYAEYYRSASPDLILRLPNFPLVVQTNRHSSGYAVISMVSTYLGASVSEDDVMRQFLKREKRNLYPASFLYYLKYNLPDMHLSLINPTNQESFLGIVLEELRQGYPVPILISSTNYLIKKKKLTLNYAVIIGFNNKTKDFDLATTFGFYQKMSLKELMEALDHRNLSSRPLLFSITEKLNLYHINNVFRIQKKPVVSTNSAL